MQLLELSELMDSRPSSASYLQVTACYIIIANDCNAVVIKNQLA